MSDIPASHCEAKKHALRQTQDGIVVSFVLHPNEVPAALQLAPLGTRYMLAFAEIGDDERPVAGAGEATASHPTPLMNEDGSRNPGGPNGLTPRNAHHDEGRETDEPAPSRARKSWHEMDYAQQAGILCANKMFDLFLRERFAGYAGGTPEGVVRSYCEVQSRADIKPDTRAGKRWELLVSAYRAWEQAPACGAA